MMQANCNDCIQTAKGTEDELIELGWMSTQTWIRRGSKKAYIKFELCPYHATPVRFVEVLKEKAKQGGIDLTRGHRK